MAVERQHHHENHQLQRKSKECVHTCGASNPTTWTISKRSKREKPNTCSILLFVIP
jgi:hypothetical protein